MDTTTADVTHARALLRRVTGDEKHEESAGSTFDVLWVLYDRVLRVDPSDPGSRDRDRFVLSKGHGPAAFYAILAAKGFFPEAWLDGFMAHGGRLGSHPDRQHLPGVEASTGSLGHGLPIGVGIARALRAKGQDQPRVVVLCGDAELNEGSNGEAILLAPHLGLWNLTLVVVDNHSSSVAMSPWEPRFGSFGWHVAVVGGHDHEALEAALLRRSGDVPTAVVADTPGGES